MNKKREVYLMRPVTRDLIRDNIKTTLNESYSKEVSRLNRQKRVEEILQTMSKCASKKEIDKVRKLAMSMSDDEFEEIEKRAKDIISGTSFLNQI